MSSGHIWRFFCRALLLSSDSMVSLAQNTDTKAPPVIDVHVQRSQRFCFKLWFNRTRIVEKGLPSAKENIN